MNNNSGFDALSFSSGILLVVIILTPISLYIPEQTTLYKMGQVDCINGKIYYKLKDDTNIVENYEFTENPESK